MDGLYSHLCRSQTTRGVWIAKAPNMEPFTLVVDLEGTDGLERGEVIFLLNWLRVHSSRSELFM